MTYSEAVLPFRFNRLDRDSAVAVSDSGDFAFLSNSELEQLVQAPTSLSETRRMELKSKFFLGSEAATGTKRLLASRVQTRKNTVLSGPSLHIFVLTLQCEHSCQYCQVSRSIESEGVAMSNTQLDAACRTIFDSSSKSLTVEFQGGDPLIRFDLIVRAIKLIEHLNKDAQKSIRFVVASTLRDLTAEMCSFFKLHSVYLSTSLDGPEALHNKNRPVSGRDAFGRTVEGIRLARDLIGPDVVSALLTTTRSSLADPEGIVDIYVEYGFDEIFMRPLSFHGFAKKNFENLGYELGQFTDFYERAYSRILYGIGRGSSYGRCGRRSC